MVTYNTLFSGNVNFTGDIKHHDDDLAKIKTGTYTGDGALSQGITGIGFQPIIVESIQDTGGDNLNLSDRITALDVFTSGITWRSPNDNRDNHIISLDADGFTVDDDGTDDDPNTNGASYVYIAFGKTS